VGAISESSRIDRLVERLVYAARARNNVLRRGPAHLLCKLLGVDIPPSVRVGTGLSLPHATAGMVIHGNSVVGDRVTIFHNVTVGRINTWHQEPQSKHGTANIGADVVLSAGAVVLIRSGETLFVGRGTVVGANAVLTESTGEWEIWAGSPARCVGRREVQQGPIQTND
jgi:serine O-acetyltransferase